MGTWVKLGDIEVRWQRQGNSSVDGPSMHLRGARSFCFIIPEGLLILAIVREVL